MGALAGKTDPATARANGELYWLPEPEDWRDRLQALDAELDAQKAWELLVALAGARLDLARTHRLDAVLRRRFGAQPPPLLASPPIRLAMLGSSTLAHLSPGVRVASARRGLHVTIHEGEYGQYRQALSDPASAFFAFRPDVALLAFDAEHLARRVNVAMDAAAADAALEEALGDLRDLWRLARRAAARVIQQTALPTLPPLLGLNEHRLPGSKARFLARLNARLRDAADAEGVDLLAVDAWAAEQAVWRDPALWLRAKQEVGPAAAPLYGDLVARLLAAQQGRSAKCLALDLDNTLWGGVVGDDGVEGLTLGPGSAAGEAFVALQQYARDLAARGVILAVCSKNDERNALAPFERHPEMRLRREDIAVFVANWNDKAQNLRGIAQALNIGLDALVFVDDNPFERNLVRAELPMVAVPELPEEPALVVLCLADAGYFESVAVTDEDRARGRQYRAHAEIAKGQAEAADLPAYLRSLDMTLSARRFDRISLPRIVQLVNKTNQFNLTTRRTSATEVLALIEDRDAFGLHLRLIDRFGDNGLIAVVVGRRRGDDVWLEAWLMSCRVLGRGVEEATLQAVAQAARGLGGRRLIGEYRPTPKNAMVRDLYARLGFARLETRPDGATLWALDCAGYAPAPALMTLDFEL